MSERPLAVGSSARTAEEVGLALGNHLVDERGLVDVQVAVLTEALKALYAYGVFSLCCHETFVLRRKARASREQWNLFQLPRRRRVSHAFACKVTLYF